MRAADASTRGVAVVSGAPISDASSDRKAAGAIAEDSSCADCGRIEFCGDCQ